ncbi:ABC transporter ATP-binding protein [Biomaibacter acetigenes]|uniref:Spermidine/putrescine import ATP-binding protein PotA n=1 Tax=Biomaibacter acetigenes TaxID=2316383 RepID=A0A3G2R7U0_9FIRM|nr:ABC transporter ATP-binding protein [Biomaibacter acetigenes]AYO31520.1 ABC transporter ATP-binding protein [Biomaibacter acetigenes]
MSYQVSIKGVSKFYGNFTALNNVTLEIQKGEFFTLLGPSGCGKTTLLRMIAGFNTIDSGEIYFDDMFINNIPAHKRNTGMVFQNYAVFPHLNVFQNVAYGLKARKFNVNTINAKVEEALKLVQISDMKARRPSQLSGGQQQRVALARAIVIQPDVLLMDEPLSNLDAKLRVQMRSDIKKLQKNLGITTIYVTHDQEEALAISDRIAVMCDGTVMQVGTPEDIYKKPANPFVAGFIGKSNFLDGFIENIDSNSKAELNILNTVIQGIFVKRNYKGNVRIAVRPEGIMLEEAGKGDITGEIIASTFLGDFICYEVKLESGQVLEINEYTKDMKNTKKIGEKVGIIFPPQNMILFDSERGELLS